MNSSLFKILIIFTAVAGCTGDKCWWQDASICQNRTCSDAHEMWRGDDGNNKQSIQLFCPKSDGHDMILCERPDWKGQCYTIHIPKGQKCANVDPAINNRAKSVFTLSGCIRLYDEANCRGLSMVFDKDTAGHNQLVEMNEKVTSVGLCTKEDRPKGGCNQANPEGRFQCTTNRCYWLGRPYCGDSSTCGNDHLMWTGHNYQTCPNQSTKFCCPKSDGHDVVLCKHFDLQGECFVTHIPRGQTCANVEVNDWVSSVHSLEGCIRLYDDANCQKLMMVFDKSTVGHNLPLEMNDRLSSVGLCSPDDRPQGGCNRASPEGRLKCGDVTTKPAEPPTWTEGSRPSPPQNPVTPKNCVLAKTSVNGKRVCKNSVIFFDDFLNIDTDKWSHEIKIASKPDYEFTVYNDEPDNIFAKDEILHLKPTVYREDFVENGRLSIDSFRCTGDAIDEECSRNTDYNILPPVQSARITTQQTFNFRYGLVEVQAQFPVGDWITAEIRLVPTDYTYGPQYESGLVRIISRGNLKIKNQNGEEMGSQTVENSVMLGYGTNVKAKSAYYRRDKGWQSKFHNFTIIWTPEDIAFMVDGKWRKNTMRNAQGSRLSDIIGLPSAENKIWSTGTSIAPFDQSFYLSLGVSVGGIRNFEDGWDYSEKSKPWSNTNPKMMFQFWNQRNEWQPSWGRNSAFRIKSVKITAL